MKKPAAQQLHFFEEDNVAGVFRWKSLHCPVEAQMVSEHLIMYIVTTFLRSTNVLMNFPAEYWTSINWKSYFLLILNYSRKSSRKSSDRKSRQQWTLDVSNGPKFDHYQNSDLVPTNRWFLSPPDASASPLNSLPTLFFSPASASAPLMNIE